MAQRISAEEVRRKLDSGSDLLLVCGYDDDQKCRGFGIEGALTYNDFRARHVPKDHEIVFF